MTRIPVSRSVHSDERALSESVVYFPLVGVVVGGLSGVAFALAHLVWPVAIAVVLSTIASVLLTGAFHEDALADSLDGFGGGWNREQVLAIMKDSRVGSYALVGTVLTMLLKLVALYAIATGDIVNNEAAPTLTPNLAAAWPVVAALVVAHMLGRWSSVLLLYAQPYVRQAQAGEKPATGNVFANAVTPIRLAIVSLFTVGVTLVVFGTAAIALVITTLALAALASRYFHRRIGGITGDALGAANQVVELGAYLVLAARPLHAMVA